jgi:hypothetical protein
MVAKREFRAAIDESLHRLGGIDVLVAHEPARLVGPDRQNGELELPVTLSRAPKMAAVAVGGIRDAIDAPAGCLDHERRPERHIVVGQIARRPMPRRNERHRDPRADRHALVPVVGLGRDGGIRIAHDGVVAKRR